MSAAETPDVAAAAPAAAPPAGKPPARVQVTWAGERRFDAARADGRGAPIRLDGNAETGPSPVDTLVSSLAACTAVDVVDILAKRRTPAEALAIDAVGERFAGVPGRLVRIHLTYRVRGAGVERAHVERAIDLAITKYCSVRESLDPAIPIEWTLELEGEAPDARVENGPPTG
jgi:putative redox protein